MKSLLILALALVTLTASAQKQRGQTCLFYSLAYVDSSRSVKDYLINFDQFKGHHVDVFHDGPVSSVRELLSFISLQVDTMDISHTGLIQALDRGYKVMATFQFTDQDDNVRQHEVVILGYTSTDKLNASVTRLSYYDPNTGRTETMKMIDYLSQMQLYAVGVHPKSNSLTCK